MQRVVSKRLAALALLVAAIFMVAPAADAATYPKNKCFFGYMDLHIFGLPYLGGFLDIFEVKNNGQICSLVLDKCGPFQITGTPTATRTEWKGKIRNMAYFGNAQPGGELEMVGQAERKGAGGVLAGVMYVTDQFFFPAIRYNGTLEGAQFPCNAI